MTLPQAKLRSENSDFVSSMLLQKLQDTYYQKTS